MIKAEVSLYPVSAEEITDLSGLSHQFLHEHGLDYDFYLGSTSLNTTITGEQEHVWTALREIFQTNQEKGRDLVMVTTLIAWG
ncbi:MAG: hypothetical protein GX335_10175 [Firmicutes bacterium]|nr:hypothetical protein [Bacillota bacterium]